MKGTLTVNMLGKLQIFSNGVQIDEKDSRSRKTWLLLAYLIYCRHRVVSQDEIIDLLWEGGGDQVNPQGTLKTTLHRLRNMLNKLEPDAGHKLILRQDGGYRWNPAVDLCFDVEKFDQLSFAIAKAPEEENKLDLCLQACEIYQGDFLEKLSSEPWVASIASLHHKMYVEIVLNALDILETSGQTERVLAVCEKALGIEPFHEQLCGYYVRALIGSGEKEKAVSYYEDLCRSLMDRYRSMPWESLRKLYRQALQTDNGYIVPVDDILSQLREENYTVGALYCEYDFFRILYQAQARAIARTGENIHIGLLTVKDPAEKNMSQKSRDLVMTNLKDVVCSNIRRGDVATRCSASQFIVMLPRADYDSSCMVCERIIRAFYRSHPHSPAEITYMVHAVEPAK